MRSGHSPLTTGVGSWYVVDDNMINHHPDELLTVSQAARRLGRSIEQVRRYLREGKLPGQRIGQQWFIPESAVGTPDRSENLSELFRRVRERREATAQHIGGCVQPDVSEILRQDREEH